MTVQEAIEGLKYIFSEDESDLPYQDSLEIRNRAIQALEEVEQYRALGTVEELKEAKEKQIPQTPNIEGDGYADGHLVYDTWICPNCETDYEIDYDDYDYCPKCGQRINREIFY